MNTDLTEHSEVQAHLVLLGCSLFHFADTKLLLVLFVFVLFYKLEICNNPALSSKFVGPIFPAALVHFMSVSHFGNSHRISL